VRRRRAARPDDHRVGVRQLVAQAQRGGGRRSGVGRRRSLGGCPRSGRGLHRHSRRRRDRRGCGRERLAGRGVGGGVGGGLNVRPRLGGRRHGRRLGVLPVRSVRRGRRDADGRRHRLGLRSGRHRHRCGRLRLGRSRVDGRGLRNGGDRRRDGVGGRLDLSRHCDRIGCLGGSGVGVGRGCHERRLRSVRCRGSGRRRRRELVQRVEAHRQEPDRVEVALRLRRRAHAEMDEGLRHLGVAARTDRPDAVALGDRRALRDGDRAEVRQRDGVTVGGRDRDALARRGDAARERDDAGGRCRHLRVGRASDVDAAMLACGKGMLRIEAERLQDGPGGGPRPRVGDGRKKERGEDRRDKESTHGDRLSYRAVAREVNVLTTVGPGLRCCQIRLHSCYREAR
jgi:hypothetical protein